jgi:Tfp pilus assembly ATPase PilU
MQTMDASLVDLVQRGRITIEAARRRASVVAEFERLLAGEQPALASTRALAGATNGYLQ